MTVHILSFPRQPLPDHTSWLVRAAVLLGALVWVLAVLGVRSLFAQVAPVLELRHGRAETPVVNSGRDPVSVTVTVNRDTATRDRIGAPVVALVSPAAFLLAPGERQLVRLHVRDLFAPGTVLRLVTTLTPRAQGSGTVRLVLVTRLASKVLVE